MPNDKIKQIQLSSTIYDIEPAETQEANIIDNLASSSSTDILSAKQGKVLNDKISAIEGRGRYLSLWDANLGQPNDLPGGGSSTTEVYTYKSGDYFIVKVAGTKVPSGTSIPAGTTKATFPNTTLTEEPYPQINDSIYFNGTSWAVLHTPGGSGDVTGPAESVANHIVVFDGTTGKVIKDSGITAESKEAVQGGTDVTLVTTGDKYNWDNKMDKVNPTGTGYFSLNRKENTTIGENSFVEGGVTEGRVDYFNTASGKASHAEGVNTTASGSESHAEGLRTTAIGQASHAEGDNTTAYSYCAHAEGAGTLAWNASDHAEGYFTVAHGNYSHAEGYYSNALNQASHAEGWYTIASGKKSHAEGNFTTAADTASHAEGDGSVLEITVSSISGKDLTLSTASHGIFVGNILRHTESDVYEYYKVSSVSGTTVSLKTTPAVSDTSNWFRIKGVAAIAAHSEGSLATASGQCSHAEGYGTIASGNASHAEGNYTIANHESQHVFGEYNIADDSTSEESAKGNYVEIVGNGTSYNARSNARTLDWSGNEVLAGKLTVGAGPTENMDVTTKQYVDSLVITTINSNY